MLNKTIIALATSLMLFVSLVPMAHAVETTTSKFQISGFQANLMMRVIMSKVMDPNKSPMSIGRLETGFAASTILKRRIERAPTYEDLGVINQVMKAMANAADEEEASRLITAISELSGGPELESVGTILAGLARSKSLLVGGLRGVEQMIAACDCNSESSLMKYIVDKRLFTFDPAVTSSDEAQGDDIFSNLAKISKETADAEKAVVKAAAKAAKAAAIAAAAAAAVTASIQETVDTTVQETVNTQTNSDTLKVKAGWPSS